MGKKTIIQNPVDWLAALSAFLIFLVENDIYGYDGRDPWGGYRVYQVDDSKNNMSFHTQVDYTAWHDLKNQTDILSKEPIETHRLSLDHYWTYVGDDFVFGITYGLNRPYRVLAWSNPVVFTTGEPDDDM